MQRMVSGFHVHSSITSMLSVIVAEHAYGQKCCTYFYPSIPSKILNINSLNFQLVLAASVNLVTLLLGLFKIHANFLGSVQKNKSKTFQNIHGASIPTLKGCAKFCKIEVKKDYSREHHLVEAYICVIL